MISRGGSETAGLVFEGAGPTDHSLFPDPLFRSAGGCGSRGISRSLWVVSGAGAPHRFGAGREPTANRVEGGAGIPSGSPEAESALLKKSLQIGTGIE